MLTLQLICLVATALSVGYLHGPPQREVCFGVVRRLATFATGETSDQFDGGGGGNADPAFDPPEVSTVTQSILLARALSKDQASAPSVHLLHPIVE